MFVGTKKTSKAVIRELAEQCNEFYVCERWLGGDAHHLVTIRQSIKKLERIEKKIAQGGEGLTKKELSLLTKDQIKLERKTCRGSEDLESHQDFSSLLIQVANI